MHGVNIVYFDPDLEKGNIDQTFRLSERRTENRSDRNYSGRIRNFLYSWLKGYSRK